ncbi:hypothetical protein [Alkalicoccus chagannorensis]|uniref:hypothetical protein n=1 Tax=Alkalicoccus chagannorensis TaxID=427072 RepID=UPI000408F3A3|nr:hypothetical protein [Alkalicoccus chagannorensis]
MFFKGFALLREQGFPAVIPLAFNLLLLFSGSFLVFQGIGGMGMHTLPHIQAVEPASSVPPAEQTPTVLPPVTAFTMDAPLTSVTAAGWVFLFFSYAWIQGGLAPMLVTAAGWLLLFVLYVWMKGGFIALLLQRAQGELATLPRFFEGGRSLFGRMLAVSGFFLVLQLLGAAALLYASTAFTETWVSMLQFLIIGLVFAFRYLFIFWEYTLASEEESLFAALRRSWSLRRRMEAGTLMLLVLIFAAAVVVTLSGGVLMWAGGGMLFTFLTVVLFTVVMTGCCQALMAHYEELRSMDEWEEHA